VKYNLKQGLSAIDTFIYDEADASEESPTALPSNKFQYVMTVNNSKLARKPYYKRLANNRFEPLFSEILEPLSCCSYPAMARKLQILYQVFTEG
jgi:hypothetical protein